MMPAGFDEPCPPDRKEIRCPICNNLLARPLRTEVLLDFDLDMMMNCHRCGWHRSHPVYTPEKGE